MYKGIGKNKNLIVSDDNALSFAMTACGVIRPSMIAVSKDTADFDKMLVEWFFSGDWIHVESLEQAI